MCMLGAGDSTRYTLRRADPAAVWCLVEGCLGRMNQDRRTSAECWPALQTWGAGAGVGGGGERTTAAPPPGRSCPMRAAIGGGPEPGREPGGGGEAGGRGKGGRGVHSHDSDAASGAGERGCCTACEVDGGTLRVGRGKLSSKRCSCAADGGAVMREDGGRQGSFAAGPWGGLRCGQRGRGFCAAVADGAAHGGS